MQKMKKVFTIALLLAAAMSINAQEVSSKAKAVRMLAYARSEYQVKDVKVYADTMTVFSLADQPIYPFGKWATVEQFITNNQLHWYRKSGYKTFYDTMTVAVNTLERLDGSNINFYRSIWTSKLEMVAARITDTAIALDNGIHVGMSKADVFKTIFKSFPKSYTSDIRVLKVIAGAAEVGEVYTFKGDKLKLIQVVSKYKYY
uniref:Uncharacterized protein n=1 Tax=uncultured bacterium fosmid pJB17E7_contig I TaxID=1478055 RepID=A0A0H3U7A5_9BACT|nr:hypothetical protein [uncultured bacterium fosmid pJB17E7_contig I]